MEKQNNLHIWLAEYCCKMKYHDCLKALVASDGGSFALNDVNSVRLSLSVVHSIVVHTFDISRFSTAVSIVNDLFDGLPIELMQYKLFAKVTTGLKILSLFSMLQCGDKLVLPKLNEYFPRTGIHHDKADKKLAEKLSIAQLRFRKFLLSLIANKEEQIKYFRSGYKAEYGQDFQNKVKNLVSQFIGIVEEALPPTHIEKLTSVESGSPLAMELAKLTSPAINLMLDILYEKKKLLEKEVKELVDKIDAEKLINVDTTEVQNKSSHGTSHDFSSEPTYSSDRKRKLPESQSSNENDKNQSDGDTGKTQPKGQNNMIEKKAGFQQDIQAHHCITDGTAPESVYEKISQVKANVPLGKIYKMCFKSSKANKSFRNIENLSEKNNKCQKKQNAKSRNHVYSQGQIPEQVQTVSSSSEAECVSQEKHQTQLSQGNNIETNDINIISEKIINTVQNIDSYNKNRGISQSISINKLSKVLPGKGSVTSLSIKPSFSKAESQKNNVYIQTTQDCVRSQATNNISNKHSLKLQVNEKSVSCRKTLPREINTDNTSYLYDEFNGAKSKASSQDHHSQYHSCLNTPDREADSVTNNSEEEDLSQSFLKMSQENSGRLSSTSMVLDSDEHSPSSSPTILASSYSTDQFEVLLERNDAEKLPALCNHLKSNGTKLCIVKLHRNKEYHTDDDGCLHDIYN